MWKIRKLDDQLFAGAAAKIHEFLDIEPLMPRGRLRLSKLFGRPVIGSIECNCVDITTIEECRNIQCTISGYRIFPQISPWMGHANDAPADIASLCIVSDEDFEFGEAWYA